MHPYSRPYHLRWNTGNNRQILSCKLHNDFYQKTISFIFCWSIPIYCITLYHTIPTFNDSQKQNPFENIVWKGENAGNQHFPTMFSTLSKTEIIIWATFILSSATAFNLVTSKILLFGKEFNPVTQDPRILNLDFDHKSRNMRFW